MKQVIDDLYTLLFNDPLLNSDTSVNIKVNTFYKYANPLIELYPALLLIRKSENSQIKTVSSGYLNTYSIDILLMTQEFEETTKSLKGIDDLDKLVKNVRSILQKNPKINGNYYDSLISGIEYQSFVTDNYINFTAIISFNIQKKVYYN